MILFHRLTPAVLVLLAGCTGRVESPIPCNIVLVMTDDQRWDTLWAMSILEERLKPSSVEFTNAIVTIPLCCPERASMLSGGFPPSQTGVLSNSWPNGGALRFDDTDTLPVRFLEAGYTTGLFGKYMNEYEELAPHIPPGWSRFVTLEDTAFDWNDYTVVQGGVTSTGEIVSVGEYMTDWFTGQALDFIDASAQDSFFLYFPARAPHMPATPAPGDEELFADYTWRGGAYDEEDISDKPAWLQERGALTDSDIARIDEIVQLQLGSLQAVDRALGQLLDRLEENGIADRTVFVFTSDNGFMWGEHRLKSKGVPYEESIRVPLLIAAPGIAPRTIDSMVAMNLDLPATLYALAGLSGLSGAPTDGEDLLPLMRGEVEQVRDRILIEGYAGGLPVWNGVRGEDYKYVEYATGDTEYYDLVADPYEEDSLSQSPPAEVVQWLEAQRGLAVTTDALADAVVGTPYTATIKTWGGLVPLSWSITTGALPDGLMLLDGVISGTPTTAGETNFSVRVSDASTSPWNGASQQFTAQYALEVSAR